VNDVHAYAVRTQQPWNTVGNATTNECYNEQFLSIKSGCYNERGGILSADVGRECARRVGASRFD